MAKSENTAPQAKTEPKAVEPKQTGFKPKIIKRVTLPTLKLGVDTPVYVKVMDPIHTSRPSKDKVTGEMKTVELLNVTDMETGEAMQIVAGTVLRNILHEEYEKESYVGKGFMIVKGPKKGSGAQGYHPYTIAEIEV